MKKNTQDWINEAIKIHGDKYDYSKVKYVNARTKVCIICPEHGEFWQRASLHQMGSGCPKCSQNNVHLKQKYNTELFIQKAKEIHGDKYDYSKVEYVNSTTKVCIICPEHGEFWQTPSSHLQGQGCRNCGIRKCNAKTFILKAKKIHGDKYDYSKVEYIDTRTKVCIICPEHGEFWQLPLNHLKGKGCPICSNGLKWTKETCLQEAKKYNTSKEFLDNNPSAWGYAYRNNILKKCIWFVDGTIKWTYETVLEESKKYTTIKDFRSNSNGAYGVAVEKHWIDDFYWLLRKKHKNGFWNYETSFIEAKKYVYLNDFEKNSPVCLQTARDNGWIKDYTWLIYKNRNIFNKLSLLESVDLENMSDHQLIELIGQDILPREFKILTKSEGGSIERKNDIKKLKDELSDRTKTDEEKEEEINREVDELEQTEKTVEIIDETNGESTEIDKYNLPELTTQELKTYDKYFVSYGEKNAYISKESINKIWNCVLSDNDYIDTVAELQKNCGEWLKYIINTFLEEYRIVNQEQVTEDYKFEYEPSLMQKLMSYRIATNPYYGNWCGTGAGKTNAFLIASRRIDARVTVCVCPNSVVDTIRKSIIAVYPNSNIVIVNSVDDIIPYDRNKFNYIIFNYEKFSQPYSQEMVEKLVSLNKIDFICFDEVHRTKNTESSTNQNLTNLRVLANKYNENLKVLGMTATPLINNLGEVRSLLELITGTSFAEIIPNTKNTINNIHNAYKYLMLYGFRFVPDYNITCKEEKIKIINDELTEQLVNFKNSDVNDIEGLFVTCKYNSIKKYITNRTIIYTQFIKKLVPNIKRELKNDGISFREYTGEIDAEERNQIITDFGEHKFDVILASSPITTGVDGLQKYCDNIIIMSLPWTNAEYTQLIGRINRQGSNFKQVNIIIPQVFIRLNDGDMWSWDEKRYRIIKNKRTLSDAVVDGRFASIFNLNRKKLLNDAIESLKNGITDFAVKRKEINTNYSIEIQTKEYKESIVNSIHQKANTSTSFHMNEYFTSNPNKWKEYHKIREENKKSWTEDPLDVIAEKLNKNTNQTIADLGCGMNQLKNKVKGFSKWYSFDHYSEDDTVIKADISNLKEYLCDNTIDSAVFCMSLWGTNYMDYIKEAYRYMKLGGIMYVVEPKDKVNQAELIGGATQFGFEIISIEFERNGKTYLEFKKVK